jgi:signal transduction histidine kinase
MKLGFIGLGRMGAAMAANLVKAGHDVIVFNRTPGRSGALIELGAHEAANISCVCDGDAVITMLADDDAASGIALGEGGLTTHLRKGAIHVSMSTISVALSKRLARAHAQAGQRYAAAPVFGRPDMAAAAKLFIVCAGDPATIDACQPLQQVLLNLIINAIQSMSSVHDRPHNLIIRCKRETPNEAPSEGVLITVEDSGTGFDAGSGERIFDSMFTTKEGGMGMGLSISRSIIGAHGGRIWASPGESVGAIFRIVLPSRREAEVDQIRS